MDKLGVAGGVVGTNTLLTHHANVPPVTCTRQRKYVTRGNHKSGRRSITYTIRQLLISFRSELRGDCANAVPTTTNYDVQSPQREMLG